MRLGALRSLARCAFRLSNEQVQEVLFTMTDADAEVRGAAYDLLGSCSCRTSGGLMRAARALLSALASRAGDRAGALRALHRMGRAHAAEVAGGLAALLDCGDRLLRPEPCIDDPQHAGVAALVLGAAAERPALLAAAPAYLPRHLRCLRDRYPEALPALSYALVAADCVEVEGAGRVQAHPHHAARYQASQGFSH